MRYEPGAYPRPFLLSRVSTPTNSPTGELGEASGLAAAGYGMEHCRGSGTRHDAVCYRRREMQNTEDAGYRIEHCRSSGIRHDAVCYRRREMQTQKTAAIAATDMPSYVQCRLGFWEGTEMCGVVNELEEGEGGCARVGRKRGEGKRKGNPHAFLCTTPFGILGRD